MELLFSYGTLQQENVQIATFGRVLEYKADSLPGYKIEQLKISDAEVVATSGKTHHPIAVPSENDESFISGTLLEITAEELRESDLYEVKEYMRKSVKLSSGIVAWVYISADSQ